MKLLTPIKTFLNIIFAVQFSHQKAPNNTVIKHFVPGNTQGNINIFDENQIDLFVILYTHERLGDVHSNPMHYSTKKSRFAEGGILKGIPNTVIYMES